MERMRLAMLAAMLPMFGAACGPEPDAPALRLEGQRAIMDHRYVAARGFLQEAMTLEPEHPICLHDLGDCSLYFARQKFEEGHTAAALREVDRAIAYYSRAIQARPGFDAALLGKNIALELKGQFEEALRVAEWAAKFVGPSAKQQMFLAAELEERGDLDGALLRFEQAVAMEPANATAHGALARFHSRHGNPEAASYHFARADSLGGGVRRAAPTTRNTNPSFPSQGPAFTGGE